MRKKDGVGWQINKKIIDTDFKLQIMQNYKITNLEKSNIKESLKWSTNSTKIELKNNK